MERGFPTPKELSELNKFTTKLATKAVAVLEQQGILKHKVTTEELDAAELRLKSLTADYMSGKIELPEFRAETEKLPRLDLRQLAQELHITREF